MNFRQRGLEPHVHEQGFRLCLQYHAEGSASFARPQWLERRRERGDGGLERLDAQTAARVRKCQVSLFNVCTGLDNDQLNMFSRALDVCISRLLRAYPQLKAMRLSSPIIERLHACADNAGIARDELLHWLVALEGTCNMQQHHERKELKEEASVSSHQAAVNRELIESNALMRRRLEAIEKAQETAQAPAEVSVQPPSQDVCRGAP